MKMSPGRASEDGEKESLVPIDIGIPFSDAEGGDHTQDRTTVCKSIYSIPI